MRELCIDDCLECDYGTPPDRIDDCIDLVAALDGTPENLYLLAHLLWIRCVQAALQPGRRSAPDDLDRIVGACDGALDELGLDGDEYPEFENAVRQIFAEALQSRDLPGDLDRAVALNAESIRHVPARTPEWALLLNGLGERYFARYCRDHRVEDFTEAEKAIRALLDFGSPARPSLVTRLGSLHEERFRAGGDVAYHRRALEILRAGWDEGSGYPMLAVSFADAVVNSGAPPTAADLDAAAELVGSVDGAALPPTMQVQWHHLVMAVTFRRAAVDGRRDAAGLRHAATAAGRLIALPEAEPGLRAEARAIRATALLDAAAITGDRMADLTTIRADLEAAAPLVGPEMRHSVDAQLARVLAEVARRSTDERDAAAAEAFAAAAVGRLPEGSSQLAEVRYHLAYQLMVRAEAGRAAPDTVDRAVDLLDRVVTDPATSPTVRAVATAQFASAAAARAFYTGGDLSVLDSAIARARDALGGTSLDDLNRVAMAAVVANALLLRYELRGDLADLRWCLDLLRDVREEAPDDPYRHELLLSLGQAQLMWSEATAEPLPADTLDLLGDALAEAPVGDTRRIQALRALATGHAMRAEWDRSVRYARETLAAVPPNAPFTALMRMSAGGTVLMAGRAARDLDLIREGTDLIGAALGHRSGRVLRGRHLAMYGSALVELHRDRPRPGDLDRALEALREAHRIATREPGHRGAAEIGLGLAAALALAGDPAGAAAAGREAIRARAWQVMLQSGTHDAMTAAGRCATEAVEVARATLKTGDHAGAWSVLESGRGLVLHAATVSATVPELLHRAGETDLAARWNAGPLPTGDGARWRAGTPDLPSDARFRALEVIAAGSDLLEPPTIGELVEALTAIGADALVHLCPGPGSTPGMAMIVDRGGQVDALDLPDLTGDWAVAQATAATRELAPTAKAGRTLADVCRAGWDAAIGRLLDHVRSRHPGEPHLVLVPGGDLAAVPWHATHADGRWAIDEATFSYIASARLLVEVARRTVPPPGDAGLVIGDPDAGDRAPSLPGAGTEATTIFRRHYAAGRFCGRSADSAVTAGSPGRPGDVLDWLTATGTPPTPVLHLACHGVISADGPASSYLLLAGGAKVSAEEILRAAAGRPAGRSPGLVSLAACTTHRAGRAYDEAVTLSTAFLVAGATTAVGSLWPVPDHETSRLMIAFHDNLAGRHMSPNAALRAAQRAVRDESPGTDLMHWAGFVHLGW